MFFLIHSTAFVWDRGAINHLLVWVQFYYLSNFVLFLKKFSAARNVVRRPSVPRYLLVLLQSHCKLMLIILTEVIALIYTQYHAERVHSFSDIYIVLLDIFIQR